MAIKPKFQTSLTLVESELQRLEALQKKGYSIIDVFRLGIAAAEKESEKNDKDVPDDNN